MNQIFDFPRQMISVRCGCCGMRVLSARVGWLLAVVAKMLTTGFSILNYLPADVFSPPNMRVFCIVCGHFSVL